MLRRTSLSFMAPLPLYKVGIVLVRQFAKPVVEQGVNIANQYPSLRRGFIYVGWCHYRLTVHLERMLWGAEQQAKEKAQEEKIKESVKEKVMQEVSSSPSSAPIVDETGAPMVEKVKLTDIDKKTTTISSASLSSKKEQKEGDGVKIGGASVNDSPSGQQQQQPPPPPMPSKVASAKSNSSTETATTPRSVKILPSSFPMTMMPSSATTANYYSIMNQHNPLKKVRKIFIAPPRPSDDDLLQKGMKLTVEMGMFMMFIGVVLWEMYHASVDKARKRKLMEERFQRLERHVIHHKDCGCPKGVKDGEVMDEDELEKRLDEFVPGRKKGKGPVVEGIGSDEELSLKKKKTAENKQQKQEQNTISNNSNTNATSSTASTTTTIGDNSKKSSASSQQATEMTASNSNKDSTHHQQQQHHSGRVVTGGGGQVVRIPSSLSDLIETWLALPNDVQIALVSMFAVPYCVMTALIIRLFTLV